MRAQVAERAGAGFVAAEPPRVRGGRPPVLQVAAPEVVDLTELPGLDHLPGEPHRRDEAVVERGHVLHARGVDAPPQLEALLGGAPERLLAEHVLPGFGRRDGRLGVQVVRPRVVEELHLGVDDEIVPVRHGALEAEASRGLVHGRLVAARDRDQPRTERRRPRHVRQGAVRVRVRLAHERVAEHADADLGPVRPASRCQPYADAGARAHSPAFCIAASNATVDGAKSLRRTNASASAAPQSRSMPLSSHSIESGPV